RPSSPCCRSPGSSSWPRRRRGSSPPCAARSTRPASRRGTDGSQWPRRTTGATAPAWWLACSTSRSPRRARMRSAESQRQPRPSASDGVMRFRRRRKLSLIAHEVGSHTLRTRNLVSVLLRNYDVELITTVSPGQEHLDNCYADLPITFRKLRAAPYPRFLRTIRQLHRAATGDVVYALKLRPTSYGVALLDRLGSGRPVLLDVDDWERYMCYPY